MTTIEPVPQESSPSPRVQLNPTVDPEQARPVPSIRPDPSSQAPPATVEPEDHLGALCEMMALLITGDADAPAADIKTQERFFAEHLAPWAARLFSELEDAASAKLYRPVGTIGRLFMTIETQAFALAA